MVGMGLPLPRVTGAEGLGGKIEDPEVGSASGANFGGSFVRRVIAAASSESAVSNLASAALSQAQQLFDVSSQDVLQRVRLSLWPYFSEVSDFRSRPDLWGPFWIATTTVLFFASTGNFARLLETRDHGSFKADYSLVSIAAGMVYGCLVAVPLLTRMCIWWSGCDVDAINLKQVVCVYGYSLTPAVPVSVACLVPSGSIRWLAVIMGFLTSLSFIRSHLWADIAEVQTLKWKMVALFCIAQSSIFGVYRARFFSEVS